MTKGQVNFVITLLNFMISWFISLNVVITQSIRMSPIGGLRVKTGRKNTLFSALARNDNKRRRAGSAVHLVSTFGNLRWIDFGMNLHMYCMYLQSWAIYTLMSGWLRLQPTINLPSSYATTALSSRVLRLAPGDTSKDASADLPPRNVSKSTLFCARNLWSC